MKNFELFDQMYAYQNIIIVMSSKFCDQILDEYVKESFWKNILIMLKELTSRVVNEKVLNDSKSVRIEIDFKIVDDFIYYIGINDRDRLCIPKFLKEEIFRQTHDENHYAEAHQCYNRISEILFIFKLLKKFRAYTEHCSSCQINQTKKHAFYKKLMPIFIASQSFHTIVINFIVKLSDKYDCFLIIIDKFSRRILFIFDYFIDFVVI